MATNQQMRTGEAELARIARSANPGAREAMALSFPQRIARAQAGLRRAQALERQARQMMRSRPNEGLRRLNNALARQEKLQRLLNYLQRPRSPYR